jgi:type II secretory pathway pseudopilin PulG
MNFSKIKKIFADESGFSLLSLVFLILVIAFAGVAVTSAILPSALTRQVRETTDRAAAIRAGIQTYAFSHGGLTGTHLPALDTLTTTDGTACALDLTPPHSTYLTLQGWCGPYVDQIFLEDINSFKTDGWGTEFTYDSATTILTSCGPNRTCGDGDDIAFAP